jgi:hypothetical protein
MSNNLINQYQTVIKVIGDKAIFLMKALNRKPIK